MLIKFANLIKLNKHEIYQQSEQFRKVIQFLTTFQYKLTIISKVGLMINSQSVTISNIQQQPNKQQPKLKPPTLIFSLMTLTNILINLDHGILPACTVQLEQTFNMSETELGFLGSIVYLGIVTMGTFAGQLYQRFNSKILTIFALATLEGSLILFVLSEHKVYAYICRYLTGVCQVFLLVYYPVWIDKFGQNRKTLWLTLLQVCVPVGIFVGYGMTAVIQNFDGSFKYSFYIQIGFVAAFLAIFILVPKSKLDSRRSQQQQLQFRQSFAGQLQIPLTENLMPSQEGLHQDAITEKQRKRWRKKNQSYVKNMKRLFRSKMYLIGTFTMSCILFVSTGIQFWMTDYFVNVQHFDRTIVNIAYGVVSITGPTSGCGFGGYMINRIGGYQNPRTIYYLLLFSSFAIGSAVALPFVDNFYAAAVLLWLVLFFGGSLMPGLTGLMMVSVPPHLRAFGNSNGEIVKNIFGYLPAPFLYGWFNYMFEDNKAGMKLIMFWGLWVPLLLAAGSLIRFKQLKNKSEKQAKKFLEQKLTKIISQQEILSPLSGQADIRDTQQKEKDKSDQENQVRIQVQKQQTKYEPPQIIQSINSQSNDIQQDTLKDQDQQNKDQDSTEEAPKVDLNFKQDSEEKQ